MQELPHESPADVVRHPRPFGMWSATALVVGCIIGSGVFLLPASMAQYGGVSLVGWAITLAGALALARIFARLAMRWPQTGGPYVFARNAFGELPGFVVAWSYWVSNWCGVAAVAVAFAGSAGALWPARSQRRCARRRSRWAHYGCAPASTCSACARRAALNCC